MSTPAPLTVEKLKSPPFKFHMHVNGAEQFSKRITRNAEFGLAMVTETNGRPSYKLTARRLVMEGTDLELDLLTGIPDYAAFCTSYNARRCPAC
ncbi:hypothetical protein [Prosthecobacter dejongeii]|uniref:Uncharacterized protein n=1 Tax=Prosthecobacter dejongeii TaxID=48465 RepID=A0A7W8DPA7_9BACT|nr:hypothetical protein [Prosthecobacter dejongeii]MBB5037127.1 hypothetical protein [Prosthecobacter dejongeii]